MKTILSIFFVTMITCGVFAQSTFVRIYNYNDYTTINDIEQTAEGGFIIGGSTRDSITMQSDWLIIKTDRYGIEEWVKIISTPENAGSVKHVCQTSDGGFLVAGSEGFDGLPKYNSVIRKLDVDGDIIWEDVYSHYPQSLPLTRFTKTADDGFICMWNYADNEIQISGGNAVGDTLWTSWHHGFNTDNSDNRIELLDDQIIVSGLVNTTTPAGHYYATILMKFDFMGNTTDSLYLPDLAGMERIITSDSLLVFIGSYLAVDTPDYDDWAGKKILYMNSDFDIISAIDVPVPDVFPLNNIFELPDGNFDLLNSGPYDYPEHGNIILSRITPTFDTLWHTEIEDADIYSTTCSVRMDDGFIAIAGIYSPLPGDDYKGFLIVVDSMGNLQKSTISGRVFFDANDNLLYDAGDTGIPYQLVQITPGTFFTSTDMEGKYTVHVFDTISYQVTAAEPDYFYQTFPEAPYTYEVEIDSFNSIMDSVDFAKNGVNDLQDLEIDLWGSAVCPGFGVNYAITVNNLGTIPVDSYQVVLTHDPLLTLDSTEIPYDTYTGSVITWNLADIALFESKTMHLYMSMSADTTYVDSVLTLSAVVEPIALDFNPIDNTDILNQVVVSAVDPNHKSVSPPGETAAGFISQTTPTLTYTIDFQNTGNYPASFVTIVDTIDDHLDYLSLRTISASHDYTMEFEFPNIVKWHFNDIYLPDSGSNYLASMGFVTFEIDLLNDQPVGTVIENTAGIYFDFNPAVLTNTVLNTLDLTNAVENIPALSNTQVYPNPAASAISFTGISGDASVRIFDMSGKLMLIKYITGVEDVMDISTLASGIYQIAIINGNNKYTSVRLVKL